MKRKAIIVISAFCLGAGGAAFGADVAPSERAVDPSNTRESVQNPADNSGRNQRDRDGSSLTSGDQGNSEADVALTQRIRKQVVGDDSLSMMAHNVKIITMNGVVTLRGPVKSQQEKERVASAAEQIAGRGKVNDNLEIAH